jgi:hypothetical protein
MTFKQKMEQYEGRVVSVTVPEEGSVNGNLVEVGTDYIGVQQEHGGDYCVIPFWKISWVTPLT